MDERAVWLRDVLGVELPARPGLLAVWRDAKDAVDRRIATLQQQLLNDPDPRTRRPLKRIVEQGLNGVTDRASVGLMAALIDAETQTQALVAVLEAVSAFRTFLASPMARLIDENPPGVPVALRETLGRALDDIAARAAGHA